MGVVLGWMSGRVLGQYDLLFAEGDAPQDAVYFVGPNIVSLERRHGFAPREFRLWIALHELTHRAQFTGVPWMRAHFLDLVERSVAIASPDPRQVLDALGRRPSRSAPAATRSPSPASSGRSRARAARDPARDSGADEPARGSRRRHDGPGGADLIPARRASRGCCGRARESVGGFTKFFQQLIGLEAKLRQYADGERFVEGDREHGRPGAPRACLGGSREPADVRPRSGRPTAWASRVRGRAARAGVSLRSGNWPAGPRAR